MSATEEVQKSMAAQPAKEKKAKAVIEKKPKASKAAAHPPYFEMIKEALVALKEKSGSSPYAIAKFMEEKHKAVLPANFRKILGLQLKNSATRGKLIKIKASYKLSESGKKEKVTAAKPAMKKAAATAASKAKKTAKAPAAAAGTKRKAETVKKAKAPAAAAGTKKKAETGKKKVAAKKAAPAKAKAPKSIKSPAAKRARRGVAA